MFIFKFYISIWVHECMSAFFTHFLTCALSNCLLHRVLNFVICKAYIYGVLDL